MMSQNLGNYANLQDPNAPEITTGQDGLAVLINCQLKPVVGTAFMLLVKHGRLSPIKKQLI